MRKLFLFIILSSAFNQAVLAQEAPTEETEPTPTMTATEKSHRAISNWSLGLSVLQWNETLKLQQSPLSANDFANYNALAVTAQTEKTYLHWGWNAGVFIGAGGAAGGGN
ncbi:MAG: hypothetical protein ACXVCY_19655, partial [Pseudobdellovibrionaceae bacterium]